MTSCSLLITSSGPCAELGEFAVIHARRPPPWRFDYGAHVNFGSRLAIAVILLIITAGGIFKQVLQDSGTDKYIASFSGRWQMPPLIFAWVITALLRVAIGSATVAGITAAAVVTPLVATGVVSPELMVLAVGAGSVFGSHINDSGFWMFKEFFNLSLKQTFMSWTVMETSISILGLAGVLILDFFI